MAFFAIPLLPAIGAAFTSLVAWIFRKGIIVFIIGTSIFFLIEFLSPLLIRLASSYFNTNPVQLVNGIPQSIWWFATAFKIDFALKVMFSALATRFLIRRIPFIG